jgi:hypothetical protein
MWVTLFALATAVSVWISAANLADQLRKDQALVHSVIESRAPPRGAGQQFSSAVPSTNTVHTALQID